RKSRLARDARHARSPRCRSRPRTSSTRAILRLAIARTGRRGPRPPGGRRYFRNTPRACIESRSWAVNDHSSWGGEISRTSSGRCRSRCSEGHKGGSAARPAPAAAHRRHTVPDPNWCSVAGRSRRVRALESGPRPRPSMAAERHLAPHPHPPSVPGRRGRCDHVEPGRRLHGLRRSSARGRSPQAGCPLRGHRPHRRNQRMAMTSVWPPGQTSLRALSAGAQDPKAIGLRGVPVNDLDRCPSPLPNADARGAGEPDRPAGAVDHHARP
ncbi:hypothetical protein GA0115241_10581, partial [Streptomyces sp. DpondAA-D4]